MVYFNFKGGGLVVLSLLLVLLISLMAVADSAYECGSEMQPRFGYMIDVPSDITWTPLR